MTVDEFQQLSLLLERVIHKYSQYEQRPRDYGNGVLLSRAELHTIMLLHNHPGIGVTMLAQKRGITKGAASQLIYRLVDKGLAEKRGSPDSDAQVCLYLTALGKETNQLHDEFHRTRAEPFFESLRSLPEETSAALVRVMKEFERSLDERM